MQHSQEAALPVLPSLVVWPVTSTFFEIRKPRKLHGDITQESGNWENSFLRSQTHSHRKRKCKKKTFFAHMFLKSGSIYIKPRPNWSSVHSTDIVKYISPTNTRHVCLSVCLSVTCLSFILRIGTSYRKSYTSELLGNFVILRSKLSRSLGTIMYNSFIAHIFVKSGAIYTVVNTNNKIIFGSFYT